MESEMSTLCNGAFIGPHTERAARAILREWQACSRGSRVHRAGQLDAEDHRQDQAALTVLAWKNVHAADRAAHRAC